MRSRYLALLLAAALLGAGCSGGSNPDSATTSGGAGSDTTGETATSDDGLATAATVRLGYFPNVTHAPAIVGVRQGLFAEELGETTLETATFNAGTDAVEALFAGAIDMTFIGPNPAINAFAQSGGEAIRIVSGTTSGGAFLVVRPDITSIEGLAGTRLSSPSLGNTQDVALRAWLAEQSYETTPEGGGDVSIVPQANSQILATFIAGEIDGARVPEPWASRMLLEGGGFVLVDETDLWPDGAFVTTHLIVSTQFLIDYPGTVKAVLRGLVRSLQFIESQPGTARETVNTDLEVITGTGVPDDVLEASWANLTFTPDPVAASLQESADDAVGAGLLEPVDLAGIYDLTLVNQVLADAGLPEVGE
jgi:NitT/TauT family transport system substrate-binding protein